MDVTFEGDSRKGTNEWLTPPAILKALGEFDLDPCSPVNRPWDTAKNHYTEKDNGLILPWSGRVFCNPPYETKLMEGFLRRCSEHKNVTALTFARTETVNFQEYVWNKAHSILFIGYRLKFHKVTGEVGGQAGAPSVLISYDEYNSEILRNCGIKGRFILL